MVLPGDVEFLRAYGPMVKRESVPTQANKKHKMAYKCLEKLFEIVKHEKSFKIQVYTIESITIFEEALRKAKVQFSTTFSSKYTASKGITIILKDSQIGDLPKDAKLILYSNIRDRRFIPYKFKIVDEEKEMFFRDKVAYQAAKGKSLSSALSTKIDMHSYTADSLTQLQAMILFVVSRNNKFEDICNELKNIGNTVINSFIIKCELNYLERIGVCKRILNNYKLTITDATIDKIASRIDK